MGAGCQLLLNEQQVLGQRQPEGQALESRGRSRTVGLYCLLGRLSKICGEIWEKLRGDNLTNISLNYPQKAEEYSVLVLPCTKDCSLI